MKIFEGNELIFRFMLINISSGIAVGMINFILPIYAISLNATSTQIGLIKGISGIGDLLMVLPAGFFVDYLGSKKMYSISCTVGGVIIILLSFAGTPNVLLLIMVAYGMARTFRTTSLSADFFKHMNAIGVKKAGWYKGSMTIGASFIGPLIGGIIAVTTGFTGYFTLTSAFLVAPVLFMLVRASNNTNNRPISQINKKNGSLIDASNHYKSLVKNRILVRSTIIESMNTAFFMTFTTFITVLVIRDMGLSPWIAAMLLSLKGGATILVVFFGGGMLRRNNNKVYLLAFIITIISLFVLGTARNMIEFGAASVVIGIGSGMITLITFTQVGNVNGEKGKIAGLFSLGHGIGAIMGPTTGGLIADVFDVRSVFLAFMIPFGILALYIFLDWKKQNR